MRVGGDSGRTWRPVLVGLVAVAVVVVLVVGFDWQAVGAHLLRATVAPLAAGVVAVLVWLGCLAEAHRLLLERAGGTFTRGRSLAIYGAGTFARLVLPVGYASSVVVLAAAFDRESPLSYEQTLASVTIAEAVSVIASAAVAIGGLAVLVAAGPSTPLLRRLGASVLGVLVVVGLLVAVLWARRRHVERLVPVVATRVEAAVDRLSARFELEVSPDWFEAVLERYVRTFTTVSSHERTVVAALALSLVGWVVLALALVSSGVALGHSLPIGVALFGIAIAGYTSVLPIPGGLGGYELALAGILHAIGGVDGPTAMAVTLLFRLCSFWVPVAVGGVASAYVTATARHVPDAP